jgi:hypothetical protein
MLQIDRDEFLHSRFVFNHQDGAAHVRIPLLLLIGDTAHATWCIDLQVDMMLPSSPFTGVSFTGCGQARRMIRALAPSLRTRASRAPQRAVVFLRQLSKTMVRVKLAPSYFVD